MFWYLNFFCESFLGQLTIATQQIYNHLKHVQIFRSITEEFLNGWTLSLCINFISEVDKKVA